MKKNTSHKTSKGGNSFHEKTTHPPKNFPKCSISKLFFLPRKKTIVVRNKRRSGPRAKPFPRWCHHCSFKFLSVYKSIHTSFWVAGFPNDFIFVVVEIRLFRGSQTIASHFVVSFGNLSLTRPSPLDTVFYVLYTIFIQLKNGVMDWFPVADDVDNNYFGSECFYCDLMEFFKFQLINDCQGFCIICCYCLLCWCCWADAVLSIWFITLASFSIFCLRKLQYFSFRIFLFIIYFFH